MDMKKWAEWYGETQTHVFNVNVFRDSQTGVFAAQIFTYSPPDFTQYFPGDHSSEINDELEELKGEDLDQLRELTKQRITARCGKIRKFENRKL